MNDVPAWKLRECILRSIPERLYDEHVEPRYTYIPYAHVRALDPGRALVVGGRGTGKTFWWETLAGEIGGRLLSQLFDTRREGLRFEVSVGHGAKALDAGRPLDTDTLAKLFSEFPERIVWKSVVLERVAPEHFASFETWAARVRWVHEHPEESARILAEMDDTLHREKRRHLVVFDAIDRTGMLWRDVVRAHRGLFGLLLDLWGMRAIRAKAFVRTDILVDPEVLRFPDASKLETAKVELSWQRADLYGLLWQYLGNSATHAEVFRSLLAGDVSGHDQGIWEVPAELRWDEGVQRALWHRLAGTWMGQNERRGDTYTWLTNHLADASGRVSPRSFLAAVRAAAAKTAPDAGRPLHYRAIQEGVRDAAEIRAREIREDFPWVEHALEALRDLHVPCAIEEVLDAWQDAHLDSLVDRDPEGRRRRRHGSALPGIIDDLADLDVVQRLRDGRINVPDVYRLRFGIKRKGGVPTRRE